MGGIDVTIIGLTVRDFRVEDARIAQKAWFNPLCGGGDVPDGFKTIGRMTLPLIRDARAKISGYNVQ
jgi:hypothetical protein